MSVGVLAVCNENGGRPEQAIAVSFESSRQPPPFLRRDLGLHRPFEYSDVVPPHTPYYERALGLLRGTGTLGRLAPVCLADPCVYLARHNPVAPVAGTPPPWRSRTPAVSPHNTRPSCRAWRHCPVPALDADANNLTDPRLFFF